MHPAPSPQAFEVGPSVRIPCGCTQVPVSTPALQASGWWLPWGLPMPPAGASPPPGHTEAGGRLPSLPAPAAARPAPAPTSQLEPRLKRKPTLPCPFPQPLGGPASLRDGVPGGAEGCASSLGPRDLPPATRPRHTVPSPGSRLFAHQFGIGHEPPRKSSRHPEFSRAAPTVALVTVHGHRVLRLHPPTPGTQTGL